MGKLEYFKEFNGKLYAFVNCRSKPQSEDAVILNVLDEENLAIYEKFKDNGKSDEEIFNFLYPAISKKPKKREISIEIEQLSKKQMLSLVGDRVGIPLPSLKKMSKNDLQELLLRIK